MKKFDNELMAVLRDLSEMANLAREMVALMVEAIKDRTRDRLPEVYEAEGRLNRMQTQIDRQAIRMLTVYGPVAKDLRFVLVCTHVTAQLERMGDQVVNIVQSLKMMRSPPASHPVLPDVTKMADMVLEIVDEAADAFFSKNLDKAIATRERDDLIDAMNDQVINELLTDEVLRQVLSGATGIADAVAQILIARYLERIADQATNICKEVIYMVKGDDVRHKRPKPWNQPEPAG